MRPATTSSTFTIAALPIVALTIVAHHSTAAHLKGCVAVLYYR